VMLLAMAGHWGTHYDYYGLPALSEMPLVPRFLWLAFFPQLIFWVGHAVILGSFAAGVYGIATSRRWARAVKINAAIARFDTPGPSGTFWNSVSSSLDPEDAAEFGRICRFALDFSHWKEGSLSEGRERCSSALLSHFRDLRPEAAEVVARAAAHEWK
jgi:hypothetical protein